MWLSVDSHLQLIKIWVRLKVDFTCRRTPLYKHCFESARTVRDLSESRGTMKLSAAVAATAIVLLLFSTPIEGKTLKTWLDAAVGISFEIQSSTKEGYKVTCEDQSNSCYFIQLQEIKVGKIKNSMRERMLATFVGELKDPVEWRIKDYAKTNFLTSMSGFATVLLLERKWGDWFITAPLGQCDVWVAHLKDSEPLVILTDSDVFGNPSKKMINNEKLAMNALKRFNEENAKQYKFVLRVTFDLSVIYKRLPESDPTWNAIDEYWDSFKKKNIKFTLYSNAVENAAKNFPIINPVFFYGQYIVRSGKWKFVLKNQTIKRPLLKMKCPVAKDACTF